MRYVRVLCCLICVFGAYVVADTQPRQQHAEFADLAFKVNYLVYRPAAYNDEPTKKWPLIIFLHGSGERGSDLNKVKLHGPPKLIEQGQTLPFIVVSPQCPEGEFWSPALLKGMLNDVIAKHRVDEDRIYLTGLSMGGFGTWDWAVAEPRRFAAIAPICGGGGPFWAKRIKDLPAWVFHGAKDPGVPVSLSEDMVKAVQAAGGKPKLTIYPDLEHDSWTVTCDNPELYKWFLEHKREPAPAKTKAE